MTQKKASQKTAARVRVFPRREILDPQGKAIAQALQRLGFDGVADVRAGKSIEVVLEGVAPSKAEAVVREMAEKLLANPVVEDYAVEVLDPEDGASSGGGGS